MINVYSARNSAFPYTQSHILSICSFRRKHSDTSDGTPLPVPGRPSKSHHHISPPQDPILPVPKRPKTSAVMPTAVHEDHVSSGVMKSSKRKGGKSKAGPPDIPSEDSTHVHTMDVTNLLKWDIL